MTIIDIARAIISNNNSKKDKNDINNYIEWNPYIEKNYKVPELKLPELTKPNRKKHSKVYAFIDSIKYVRSTKFCTVLPIPTTKKQNVSICGSHQEVSRLIDFMKEIGLIEIADDNYQFNSKNKKYNKSKTYKYYYENELKLKKYYEENDINKCVIKNDTYEKVNKKILPIANFNNDQVKFSSKLHLMKPDNYTISQFENYLYAILYENYPLFRYYQSLADEINYKYYYDYPEMALCFIPTFTWNHGNKSIKKIGIRCTNSLVSAKNNKEKNENFYGLFKEDILKLYKFNLNKDIKSSIPRITLSINKGKWISEDVDIYKEIYKNYKTIKENDEKEDIYLPVVRNFFEIRESIKFLHMRGYFDNEKMLGIHTAYAMGEKRTENELKEIDKEMSFFKEAIILSEGTLYDNEIFLHESCICIDVLHELLEEGYFVWNCYDCFYARKKGVSQEQFETHVSELIEQKANEYILKINNIDGSDFNE